MSTLKVLIKKEVLQFKRNSFLPRLVVAFPIVIMLVLPWVTTMDVRHVKVSVVDNDHSQFSQRIIGKIQASEYLSLHSVSSSFDLSLRSLEDGEVDAILEVPHDFEKSIATGFPKKVSISANSVNATKGSLGTQYLAQTLASGINELRSSISPTRHSDLFVIQNRYNPTLEYRNFMIPALLAILMIIITGFLPALNLVGEKEAGTIEQINVTPVSKWSFILAKLIPYWLIALFIITVCLLLAWIVYGITPAGPVWLVYVLAMLLALFFSSFGLIISNYSDTMQQAMFVMWFFVVSIMLLSGLFTPTRSMPQWAYLTTYINPMHYFIEAIRTVFIRGGGLHETAHQVLALAGIGTLMGCWAVQSYKKNS